MRTELDKELALELEKIYNDDDFIIGISSNARTQEDRKIILEYIKKGEDVTVENLILLSLFLNNKRYHPERNLKGNDEF